MKKNSIEEEPIDDSPTDELPVLTELDVVDDPQSTSLIASLDDDTGQFDTVRVPSLESAPPDDTANLSLEVQLTELRALAADKDATIASLEERLEATRRAVARRDRAERALRAELDQRERHRESLGRQLAQARNRLGELERQAAEQARNVAETRREIEQKGEAEQQLLDWLVNEEQQRAALSAELEQSRARAGELEADLTAARDRTEALQRELDERRAAETREAREAGHEAERRRPRADLQRFGAEREAAETRSAELERERDGARKPAPGDAHPSGAPATEPPVAEDVSELRRSREEAAALAAYIENRHGHWNDLRARLAERDAELAELRQELEQRVHRQQQAEEIASSEQRRTKELQRELRELRFRTEARRRDEERSHPPRHSGGSPAAAGAQQLEPPRRELETLRQAAADRDAELARMTERHAELQQRFDAANAQLAEARAALARLERLLPEHAGAGAVDRDATDAWPSDGGESSGLRETLSLIPGGGDAPPPPGERKGPPVLVCLTGEAPRSYPVTDTMTIGRAGHCEIQVVTQFVSREHARLAVKPEGVQIEDLGSKNGVFVNSVRVEREALRNGDLVTVGETQFRFLAE